MAVGNLPQTSPRLEELVTPCVTASTGLETHGSLTQISQQPPRPSFYRWDRLVTTASRRHRETQTQASWPMRLPLTSTR